MRLLAFITMACLPSKFGGAEYRRICGRLQRQLTNNTVATPQAAISTSASSQYVSCDSIYSAVMSTVAYAFLLFMLINTSSMLEIYMIGVAFVMVYILELIMKLSNLSTITTSVYDLSKLVRSMLGATYKSTEASLI